MQIMLRALYWLTMLILFPYSKERNCSISLYTIEYTDSCPKNMEEWKAREKMKKCENITQHCTEKEYFRYHCVRNAFMNRTLEVCAPIWYSSGFCIEFNKGGERIQDNYEITCTHFATPCPTTYVSTDIYKYPECYSIINKTGNGSRSCDEKKCTTLNFIFKSHSLLASK
ncbi:uncharacterized protein LOC134248678 [Saccostrea cucullata]|uniref:uncharacterized protein LOC134248678 n=1 Tax=Saccostrea cuccullata TaxID=36930 RepID=UPI002ED5D0E3